MIETGDKVSTNIRLAPFGAACDGTRARPAGRRWALLGGIAGLALLAGLTAPVTMDGPDGEFAIKSALAAGEGVGGGGGGGGGAGGGGGIGGGSEGKRKFPGADSDGDDDDDDDGPGDTGGGDDDDDDTGGGDDDDDDTGGDDDDDNSGPGDAGGGGRAVNSNSTGENHGGGGGATAADVASTASFDAIRAIEGAPAASLPTVREIFALPGDAILSSADEMRFISQGWGKPAE